MAKLSAAARKKLPESAFALPEKRMFPIHDAEHIKLAWRMLQRAKSLTEDERKAAAKAVMKAAKAAEIDTSEWIKPKAKADGAHVDEGEMDDIELPTVEDLTVEAIGKMTEGDELCAAWCLAHEIPLTSVERAALLAAITVRANTLQISMYSWDYWDGGKMAGMSEKLAGDDAGEFEGMTFLQIFEYCLAQGDAAKATPALEAIAKMGTVEELRKAYVDVREAALTAEVREGLEGAIRSRCDTMNINFWNWKVRSADDGAQAAGDAAEGQFVTMGDIDVYVGPAIMLDEGNPATGRPIRRRFRVSRTNIQAHYKNHNLRAYPHDYVREAVDAANADIAAGRLAPGEMYHPEAYQARDGAIMFKSAFERQVFKWEKFHLAEDGTVYGDAAILEHTPAGAIVAGHIRNGVPVPVSVRWLFVKGSTIKATADGSQVEIPNRPLRIKTVDAVPNPAMDDAHDIQSLDAAQMDALLAAPTADPEGAASVSPSNPSTDDSGAQGAQKEDDTMTPQEILAALKTPDGQALLKEMFGAQFDSAVKAAEAFDAQEAEKARKTAVKAVADAADLSRFDKDTIATISDAVMQAPDAAQAKAILDSQTALADKMTATMKASRLGYPGGAAPGQVRVDSVKEGRPWRQAVDKMKAAFDDAGLGQGNAPDSSLRKANARHISKLTELYEGLNGKALYDACQAANDSGLELGDLSRSDAATTTSLVLNQPIVQQAIVEQSFQDTESLQFVTVRTDAEGGVFKVPSEYYTAAATGDPGDIIVAEMAAISEGNVNLVYLTFSPIWRRIATTISKDVIDELRKGPTRYDVLGRSLYHIPREKARVVDLAIYRDMLVTSDEYGAVAVNNGAENLTPAAGAGGTNVAWVYTLKRGTADGATRAPIVRPRQLPDLTSGGAKSTTTRNPFTLKAGATTLTRGYLDGNGNIQGGDYAVAWETGKVYIKAETGIDPEAATPVHPTVSYSYATNYDEFDLTPASGVKLEDHLNGLLVQVDQTAALMGSSPRFKKPNVGIMSLNAGTNITNASLFWKQASPNGTELLSSGSLIGRRNNVNFANINAPWDAGDGRMLLTQIGATQYGVATPFEMEPPQQKYTIEGGELKIVDAKIWYGREHSGIFTPQPTDAAGKVLNPFNRTVVFYRS